MGTPHHPCHDLSAMMGGGVGINLNNMTAVGSSIARYKARKGVCDMASENMNI